jgi:hypothetical protein
MAWILAALVFALATLQPRLRKAAVVGLALVVAGLAISLFGRHESRVVTKPTVGTLTPAGAASQTDNAKMANSLQTHAMVVTQLRADDLRANSISTPGPLRINKVTAQIHNDSERETLESIDLRLSIQDCRSSSRASADAVSDCATVHEQTTSLDIEIAPKQSKELQIALHAPPWDEVHLLGSPRLKIDIIAARSK